jgi:hypothetical protein
MKSNQNKKQKKTIELDNLMCEINFAYCPLGALKINHGQYNTISEHVIREISGFDEESSEFLINALRYFYIFYSIKLKLNDEILEETFQGSKNNYFYFQVFAQVGNQNITCPADYGFVDDAELLSTIREVDSLFEENHDKNVCDTFNYDINGPSSQVLDMLEEWGQNNLENFQTKDYFADKEAIKNLNLLIEYAKNKPIEAKKNTKKSKSAAKNTNKARKSRKPRDKKL